MVNSEFTVAGGRRSDSRSPVRWIVSHGLRYPLLPIALVLAAIGEAGLYALTPVLVGRAFDLLSSAQVVTGALLTITLLIVAQRLVHGVVALLYAYTGELIAKRMERDTRDELMRSLLGKSQTFHNRDRKSVV